MQASILSLIAGTLMAVSVKATHMYGEFVDRQCSNPIFIDYFPTISYEDAVCTTDGLVPNEKFVSIGHIPDYVSWDFFPNINDGAVAIGAFWKESNQCSGQPSQITVFYAPYNFSDDDSAVYQVGKPDGGCYNGGYYLSSRFYRLNKPTTSTTTTATTTTSSTTTTTTEKPTTTTTETPSTSTTVPIPTTKPSTSETVTTATLTSTYNPVPTSSDGTGPSSSGGPGPSSSGGSDPTNTYSVTSVTRTATSTTSKRTSTSTTTSSPTPSPTPGSASGVLTSSFGALVAGIVAAFMI